MFKLLSFLHLSDRNTPFPLGYRRFQCYKLFDRGRLAAALHHTDFQETPPSKKNFQRRNVRHFHPGMDARWNYCIVRQIEVYTTQFEHRLFDQS